MKARHIFERTYTSVVFFYPYEMLKFKANCEERDLPVLSFSLSVGVAVVDWEDAKA